MSTRILIIDDMEDFRLLVRAMLQAEMPDVELDEMEGAARTEDIQTIIRMKYDVILLDYRLEGHDGLSVQRNLRDAGVDEPIILLTAYGNEKLAVRAIKEGAFDYLSKADLDKEGLVNSIRGALKSRVKRTQSRVLFGDNIQINGYRPVKLLGRGHYSMVYLAESKLTERHVVLKILIVSNVTETDIGRFMREYEIMSDLSHENIGIIHEQEFTEDIIYIMMEHLEGGTLEQRLQVRKRFPETEATALMITLFDALHYIHQHGVLHRDIKPANIVYRSDGTPVIVDFGIASKVDIKGTLTDSGSVVGTPTYMSPEQAMGEAASVQSDIYSMGVVYYEILTGVKPIDGDTPHEAMYCVVHNEPAPLPPEYSHLQDIFDSLLAKQPEKRFKTCYEVADLLRHLQESRQSA